MRKLIAQLAALAAAPFVAFAAMQTAAPAFADTPGVSPTCFPQSANPHPTDPAGSTTATLFCTPPSPSASSSASSGSGKSGGSGSGRSNGSGAGTTSGGGQTSLASSTGSSSPRSAPDESMRFNGASDSGAANAGAGKPAASNDTGLFGGLVAFFSSAGVVVFLFGLLALMLIILVALAITAWLGRGPARNWASRFSRLTFRA